MRNLSASALTEIATKLGTEPIAIMEVDWTSNGTVSYADRTVQHIKGRILDISPLDNIVDVLNSSNSQEISVTLDDTDGSIKGIFDTHDVHQRDVRVYQWFDGLDLSDRFLLFSGKISSPVRWDEADRTVSFSVVSQLEDREFGFSAEEGQFPFVPKDLVGKPWPVIFGRCLDVPALQINTAVSGSTLCGVGILSGTDLHNQVVLGGSNCGLGMSLAMLTQQMQFLSVASNAWAQADPVKSAELLDQRNQVSAQLSQAAAGQSSQKNCANAARAAKIASAEGNGLGCNPVRILGGEDFPQGTPITLNINGGLFTGIMNNDQFSISNRSHPENEARAQELYDNVEDGTCETPTPNQYYDFQMEVPPGQGDNGGSTIRHHGFIFCNQGNVSRPTTPQVAQHFWADAGSRAVIASDEPIYYIVSITPGSVLAVKAYKTLNGERRLVNVPNNYWSVESVNYGSITAVQLRLSKPLSSLVDQGWSDDIYVTFESTIGPDTVEILQWIINNYTDLSYDASSFSTVSSQLSNFPANFPVLERKNTIELLREIAFQARCALWISNGTFYIKYLPAEPASDADISVSDIALRSTSVELTRTEDIITKFTVNWRVSWAGDPDKMILRHNVAKYGTKSQEFDWYIYNQPDIVLKAATFWLIRKANTWKKIRFQTYLNHLNLETFDTVNLDLGDEGYVANTAVKAIVEQADYDSENNLIQFECLVPVRAGELTKYQYFWPSSLTVSDTFPTPADIASGNAGGYGIGTGASGNLPIGFTSGIGSGGTVFVGGPNVVFRSNSDRGDRTPGDVGFTPQTIIPDTVYADLEVSQNPDPDLTLNYIDPLPAVEIPSTPVGESTIDIRRTKIIDSNNPGNEARLSSIIRQIFDSQLVLDTTGIWGDGTVIPTQFDFRYDDETQQFGAGTAFLQDN